MGVLERLPNVHNADGHSLMNWFEEHVWLSGQAPKAKRCIYVCAKCPSMSEESVHCGLTNSSFVVSNCSFNELWTLRICSPSNDDILYSFLLSFHQKFYNPSMYYHQNIGYFSLTNLITPSPRPHYPAELFNGCTFRMKI